MEAMTLRWGSQAGLWPARPCVLFVPGVGAGLLRALLL